MNHEIITDTQIENLLRKYGFAWDISNGTFTNDMYRLTINEVPFSVLVTLRAGKNTDNKRHSNLNLSTFEDLLIGLVCKPLMEEQTYNYHLSDNGGVNTLWNQGFIVPIDTTITTEYGDYVVSEIKPSTNNNETDIICHKK